jgi:hypothetical protein
MRIHDLRDEVGRVFAFEVPNTFLGRRGARRVVGTIPGARILSPSRERQAQSAGAFCEFELDGEQFSIEEPFGDNSRYWIGPRSASWVPQIAVVRDAFSRAGFGGWFNRAAG